VTTYKGIAAVTQTLGYLAGAAVLAAVPEARVTLARPEEPAAGSAHEPRLNIYLVQVLPDPMLRSDDLPTRDADGHLLSAPRAPVNLRYLLSFFGESEKAHLMLGAVEVALRSQAVLNPTLIRQALASYPELLDSGLDVQHPPVRVVPSSVTLEELARFWSGFLQVPYTVSTLYEALTVVLTATESVTAPLPVRQVGGGAGALPPQLKPLPTVQFTQAPPGTVVPVTGTGLSDQQLVQITGLWVPLEPGSGGLQLTLPPTVAAGTQIATLGTAAPGQSPSPIAGSLPQVLRIRPEVISVTATGTGSTASPPGTGATGVTITVAPPVQAGQEVVISLVEAGAGADPVTNSTRVTVIVSAATNQLSIAPPAGLPAGDYLTLVEVDGVASLPTAVGGLYAQPMVGIP